MHVFQKYFQLVKLRAVSPRLSKQKVGCCVILSDDWFWLIRWCSKTAYRRLVNRFVLVLGLKPDFGIFCNEVCKRFCCEVWFSGSKFCCWPVFKCQIELYACKQQCTNRKEIRLCKREEVLWVILRYEIGLNRGMVLVEFE